MVSTWMNPTMTSATAPYGVVSTSSDFTPRFAWYAFDHDLTTTNFWSTDGVAIGWIQYKFEVDSGHASQPTVIDEYKITGSPSEVTRSPKDWTIKASNTGAFSGEEVTLDTVTGETGWGAGETRTYTPDSTGEYVYYRLDVTANNGDVGYLQMCELQLWGYLPTETENHGGVSIGSADMMVV